MDQNFVKLFLTGIVSLLIMGILGVLVIIAKKQFIRFCFAWVLMGLVLYLAVLAALINYFPALRRDWAARIAFMVWVGPFIVYQAFCFWRGGANEATVIFNSITNTYTVLVGWCYRFPWDKVFGKPISMVDQEPISISKEEPFTDASGGQWFGDVLIFWRPDYRSKKSLVRYARRGNIDEVRDLIRQIAEDKLQTIMSTTNPGKPASGGPPVISEHVKDDIKIRLEEAMTGQDVLDQLRPFGVVIFSVQLAKIVVPEALRNRYIEASAMERLLGVIFEQVKRHGHGEISSDLIGVLAAELASDKDVQVLAAGLGRNAPVIAAGGGGGQSPPPTPQNNPQKRNRKK